MTFFFEKKISEVINYDACVIVDNFVETGDFSGYFIFWIKNNQCFFGKLLQEKNSK